MYEDGKDTLGVYGYLRPGNIRWQYGWLFGRNGHIAADRLPGYVFISIRYAGIADDNVINSWMHSPQREEMFEESRWMRLQEGLMINLANQI